MKTLIYCCLLFINIGGYTQNLPVQDAIECPDFIISSDYGKDLVSFFRNNYSSFKDSVINDSIIIKIGSLKALLNGINGRNVNGFKIYFGQEKIQNTNKLVFIFRGMKGKQEIGGYFRINSNEDYMPINSQAEFHNLVTAYTNTQRYTNETLKKISPKGYSDNTSSYMFNRGLLQDIREELERQLAGPAPKIKKICFRLGAYFDESFNPGHVYSEEDFQYRIMVGLSFMDSQNIELPIESLSSPYNCRLPKEYFLNPSSINGDTGVPCPPGKGCATSTLQQ